MGIPSFFMYSYCKISIFIQCFVYLLQLLLFNCFSFTSIDALLIFYLFYGYLSLLVYGFFVIHYNYIFLRLCLVINYLIFQSLLTTSFAHCFIIFCLHRTFGPLITSSYSVLLFYFEYSSSFFKTSLFFCFLCCVFCFYALLRILIDINTTSK